MCKSRNTRTQKREKKENKRKGDEGKHLSTQASTVFLFAFFCSEKTGMRGKTWFSS
jgi:hypothetical protein